MCPDDSVTYLPGRSIALEGRQGLDEFSRTAGSARILANLLLDQGRIFVSLKLQRLNYALGDFAHRLWLRRPESEAHWNCLPGQYPLNEGRWPRNLGINNRPKFPMCVIAV